MRKNRFSPKLMKRPCSTKKLYEKTFYHPMSLWDDLNKKRDFSLNQILMLDFWWTQINHDGILLQPNSHTRILMDPNYSRRTFGQTKWSAQLLLQSKSNYKIANSWKEMRRMNFMPMKIYHSCLTQNAHEKTFARQKLKETSSIKVGISLCNLIILVNNGSPR